MEHTIDFSTITACGECCSGCKKKMNGICKGCIEADGYVPEWSDSGRCKIHVLDSIMFNFVVCVQNFLARN